MGFFEYFRRPPPIRDAEALADSSTAMRPSWCKKAFTNIPAPGPAIMPRSCSASRPSWKPWSSARWRAYPLGLAMVGELVEGVLRPYGADRLEQLDALRDLVLSVFDRYPVPAVLGTQVWSEARAELARRLAAGRPAPAEARLRDLRAVGGNLLQSDADPREAAQQRIPDHPELSAGHALQHP